MKRICFEWKVLRNNNLVFPGQEQRKLVWGWIGLGCVTRIEVTRWFYHFLREEDRFDEGLACAVGRFQTKCLAFCNEFSVLHVFNGWNEFLARDIIKGRIRCGGRWAWGARVSVGWIRWCGHSHRWRRNNWSCCRSRERRKDGAFLNGWCCNPKHGSRIKIVGSDCVGFSFFCLIFCYLDSGVAISTFSLGNSESLSIRLQSNQTFQSLSTYRSSLMHRPIHTSNRTNSHKQGSNTR